MMRNLAIALAALIALASCTGCEKDANEENPIPVDKTAIKRNLTQELILPAAALFADQAQVLSDALIVLRDDSNLENLEAARIAWVVLYDRWHACLYTKVGDNITDTFIHSKLYNWPANAQFIENHINNNEAFPDDFAESIGSNSKGMGGVEYILWADGQTSEGEILNGFNEEPKRLMYAASIGVNLANRSSQLKDLWTAQSESFISSTATGTDGSINLLVNLVIRESENLKLKLLQTPLGLDEGESPDPTTAQAFRSEQSLIGIENNVELLRNYYYGIDQEGNNGMGIDDLLLDPASVTEADRTIHNRISASFEDIEGALANIDGSFEDALENDFEDLVTLHEKTSELFVLFFVDLSVATGIQVVFGDNDGDS